MRLRQRIGSFQLDRVLRRQHEKWRRKLVQISAHGAGVLLHRFEERGLRLGRRAVDLVGQQHVPKYRSFDEGPLAMAGRQVLFDDVRARDIRRH